MLSIDDPITFMLVAVPFVQTHRGPLTDEHVLSMLMLSIAFQRKVRFYRSAIVVSYSTLALAYAVSDASSPRCC